MKAIATNTLILMILAITGLIILILGPGQKLYAQIKETTDTGIKNIKITPELLEQKEQEALTEYNRLFQTGKLNPELASTFDPTKQGAMQSWAINKIIADELIKCTTTKQKITKVLLGQQTEGITCQICARIEITPETLPTLQQNFYYMTTKINQKTQQPDALMIDTKLNTWMHNVPYEQATYAQKLKQTTQMEHKGYEEILNEYPMEFLQLNYEQPIGIVNVIVPINVFQQTVEGTKDMTWTQIYPYDQVTTFNTLIISGFGTKLPCQNIT